MRSRQVVVRGVVSVLAITATLGACGGDDDDDVSSSAPADATSAAPSEDGGETYTIRLPHHLTPDTHDARCIQDFADEVTARSEGRITFEITPAGALGGEAEVEQNLFEGVFEMTLMSNVLMGEWYEPANLVSLPWLFRSTEEARTVYDSDLFAEMKEGFLAERGARILDYCSLNERAVATKNPIATPEDFDGVKIRVPELPVFIRAFETLGALPTPLPFPEVYEAMSSGIVDGADADFSTFATLGFTNAADHFTRTGHQISAQYLIINEEFFQSLPADLQEIIVDTSTEVVAGRAAERTAELADQFAEELRAAGGDVVDDLDKTPFRDATAEVRRELADDYDVTDELAQVEELLG